MVGGSFGEVHHVEVGREIVTHISANDVIQVSFIQECISVAETQSKYITVDVASQIRYLELELTGNRSMMSNRRTQRQTTRRATIVVCSGEIFYESSQEIHDHALRQIRTCRAAMST